MEILNIVTPSILCVRRRPVALGTFPANVMLLTQKLCSVWHDIGLTQQRKRAMLNRSSIFAFAAIAALGTAGAIPSSAFAGLLGKAATRGAEAAEVGKAARGAEAGKAARDYWRDKALEQGGRHEERERERRDSEDSH